MNNREQRAQRSRFFSFFFVFAVLIMCLAGRPPLSRAQNEEKLERLIAVEYDVWSIDWRPDGRIVFSGKKEGEIGEQVRIWLYKPGPENEPVLWTGTGTLVDTSPKWAPDGSGVVMVRKTVPGTATRQMQTALWWKAFPSGEGLRLTTGPEDRDPAWSPDGEKIVFVRGDGLFTSSLMAINRNGTGLKTILPACQGFITTPHWGKDNKLYYTLLQPRKTAVKTESLTAESWGLDQGRIWVFDPATGENRPLLEEEKGNDHRHPAVSPSGRYLAYVATRGGNGPEVRVIRDRGSLIVLDLKTQERFRVTDGVSLNGGTPCWSPDEKKIAFLSFRDNRPAAWEIEWQKYAVKE